MKITVWQLEKLIKKARGANPSREKIITNHK
jgi:hypothetical protein